MSEHATAPSTDESLLVRIRDPRDEAAWKMFVDLYLPVVYGYCGRFGLQDADAQDVSQEVFERVSRAIRTFEYDPQKGRFRGWLGRVVRNQAIRKRRQGAKPGAAPGAGTDEELLESLQADNDPLWLEEFNARVLQAAMEQIRLEFDEPTLQAFELTWIEQRTAIEVADSLGRSTNWVYLAKFNVLKRLKEVVLFLTDDVGFFQQ